MKTNFKKWPMESAATNVNPAPTSRIDGLTDATLTLLGLVEDAFGVLVETTRLTIPANTLPPAEYEARIAAHAARVARELARQGKMPKSNGSPSTHTQRVKDPHLPGKFNYRDLKVVNCAKCKKTLLGESQEGLREAAIAAAVRSAANFPPKVGGRVDGRPYCLGCVPLVEEA